MAFDEGVGKGKQELVGFPIHGETDGLGINVCFRKSVVGVFGELEEVKAFELIVLLAGDEHPVSWQFALHCTRLKQFDRVFFQGSFGELIGDSLGKGGEFASEEPANQTEEEA